MLCVVPYVEKLIKICLLIYLFIYLFTYLFIYFLNEYMPYRIIFYKELEETRTLPTRKIFILVVKIQFLEIHPK